MKNFLYLFLFFVCLYSCDAVSNKIKGPEIEKESNNPTPELIGNWKMSNPPKDATVDFNFKSDGTLLMHGTFNRKIGIAPEEKNINCTWTKNDNKIYVTTPGEREVGIMEILSLDNKSLVIHIKGEPENELMYFVKN